MHVELREPKTTPVPTKPISLSLDDGGDLFYTIWLGDCLANTFVSYIQSNLDEAVEYDPSDKLQRIGVTTLRCFNLKYLADTLKATGQLG